MRYVRKQTETPDAYSRTQTIDSPERELPEATAHPGRAFIVWAILLCAIAFVCFLWSLNYNRLGSFYDYSIIADAAGKFGAGLRPFRDFTSAVQTLIFWVANGCELLFGRRYLALAYGNLALSLAFFGVIVFYARKVFAFPAAVLIGLAVVTASTLQHGIIWYNSLALVFTTAAVLKAAVMLRARAAGVFDVVLVGFLLLAGITKINFFAAALLIAVAFAAARAVNVYPLHDRRVAALVATLCVVCCLPPLIEAVFNHVSISTWVEQAIRTPDGRIKELKHFANPLFYLGMVRAFYPGVVLEGSVLFCLVGYASVGYAAWKEARLKSVRVSRQFAIQLGLLAVLWFTTFLLTVTNVEILSFCLCFCLPGLVALKLSGYFESSGLSRAFSRVAVALAVYFLIVGAVSIARHSRLLYEPSTFVAEAAPDGGAHAYLGGVILTQESAHRLAAIDEVLAQSGGVPVYWGPGLELMNRIRRGVSDPAFPLWYHLAVTVRESGTPRLIDGIERSGARLIIADHAWFHNFPDGVLQYLDAGWQKQERDGLVIWRKKS